MGALIILMRRSNMMTDIVPHSVYTSTFHKLERRAFIFLRTGFCGMRFRAVSLLQNPSPFHQIYGPDNFNKRNLACVHSAVGSYRT